MKKILLINGCESCEFCDEVGEEMFCNNPSIKEPTTLKEYLYWVGFPAWCPLEDYKDTN